MLLNGRGEVELLSYGPVFAIVLPAGEHRVLITTAANVVTPGVFGFWIVAVAATVYLLRNLWLWLTIPALPSVGIRAAVRRWIFEPPFVRESAVSGGALKVSEPRTARRLDIKMRDGSYRRISPSNGEASIAMVLVELGASANEHLEFDFARLTLRSAAGREFRATPLGDLQSQDLAVSNPLHLVNIKKRWLVRQ